MAYSYEDILEALQQAGVDAGKTRIVLENLKAVEEEKKEEKENGPKQKNQFVVFVMDDGSLTGKDLIGYVIQIPENASPAAARDSFVNAVRGYNNGTRKAKKYPVKTIGDGMSAVKGKWLKDSKIKVKTKEAILIIPVKNDIENPTKEVTTDE